MISLPETETLCSVPKIAWLNAGKELGLEITLMCWTVEKAGLCFCKAVGVLVGECWSSFLSQSSFSNAVLSKSAFSALSPSCELEQFHRSLARQATGCLKTFYY